MSSTKPSLTLWETLEASAKESLRSEDKTSIDKRHAEFLAGTIDEQLADYLQVANLSYVREQILHAKHRNRLRGYFHDDRYIPHMTAELEYEIQKKKNPQYLAQWADREEYFQSCPNSKIWAWFKGKKTKKEVRDEYEKIPDLDGYDSVMKLVLIISALKRTAHIYSQSVDEEQREKSTQIIEILCQLKTKLFKALTQLEVRKVLGSLDKLGTDEILAPVGELLAQGESLSTLTGVRVVIDDIGLYEEAALEVEEITRDKAKARR